MNLKILKKMPVTLVAIMIMATVGVTGVSAAGQGAYGSQVKICEDDDTYVLKALPGAVLRWQDNLPAGIGWEDNVYLDVDASGRVSPKDIRITEVTVGAITYLPGSQVVNGDNDIGPVIVNAPPTYFVNEITNPGGPYDLGDQVVINPAGGPLALNDMRISKYGSHLMGDLVQPADGDIGWPTVLLPVNYQYYDVNGNGEYNIGDHVIMDMDFDGLGTVNDLRLTPFVACDTTYQEGTKITETRLDAVHVLDVAGFALGWWNADSIAGYSAGDMVYIDCDANGFVSVDDVRLTPWITGAVGTQVIATDTDCLGGANVLTNIPLNRIQFVEMTGFGYSLDDPVIIDMTGPGMVSINDIVLSDGIPASGLGAAGTKVVGNPYMAWATFAMPGGTILSYFDHNGEVAPTYNTGDYAVLDVGGQGFSSANDVRLSQPTFGLFDFGTKVEPKDYCCVDGLTNMNERIRFWDHDGSSGYSYGDTVYLCTWGLAPFDVEVNYIRLTPLVFGSESYEAGSVVMTGNVDQGQNTDPVPVAMNANQAVKYYDMTSNGITTDDPIFVDIDDSDTITELDIRVTPYSTFEAGSKVLLSDGDVIYNEGLTAFVGAGYSWTYFDMNSRIAFEADDYAYLDICSDGFASTNDVRITGDSGSSPCPADITGDGTVDIDDLFEILNNWGGISPDLTGDGNVDIDDLFVILNAWGPCP